MRIKTRLFFAVDPNRDGAVADATSTFGDPVFTYKGYPYFAADYGFSSRHVVDHQPHPSGHGSTIRIVVGKDSGEAHIDEEFETLHAMLMNGDREDRVYDFIGQPQA